MKNALRLAVVCALLAMPLLGQLDTGAVRAFAYPEDVVNLALARLNTGQGGRLPALEDFAIVELGERSRYSVPYYQLSVEAKADGGNNTIVRVSAHITALYTDPQIRKSEYRTLPSNGHLEQDLLERLEHELGDQTGIRTLDRKTLEAAITDMRSQQQTAEQRKAGLKKQVQELEARRPSKPTLPMVAVTRAGVAVHAGPADVAPVLFHAQARDEFELIQEQAGWSEVRLAADKGGWMRSADVRTTEMVAGLTPPARPDFEVIRENVMPFLGSWAELKGKPTLFLWVRSTASFPAGRTQNRWEYVRRLFEERAETARKVNGIVVLFTGDGGVAAATLRDIHRWSEGALTDSAFRARCSLDPPRAFVESSSKPGKDNPSSGQ